MSRDRGKNTNRRLRTELFAQIAFRRGNRTDICEQIPKNCIFRRVIATKPSKPSHIGSKIALVPRGASSPTWKRRNSGMRKKKQGEVPDCLDCERPMAKRSRQLCTRCWRAHARTGTLTQFPAWANSVGAYEDFLILLTSHPPLSQKQMAARIGVHVRTISRYQAHRVGKERIKSLEQENAR